MTERKKRGDLARSFLSASDLTHDVPHPDRSQLDPGSASQIEDAWESGAVLDAEGILWVDTGQLHTILRTRKEQARLFVQDVGDRHKVSIDGTLFVRGYLVVGEMYRQREETANVRRWRLLDFSTWFPGAFGESHQAKLRRIEVAQDRAPGIKKLKRERMKRFGVTADELTGRPLHAADAQFAHIVAQSVEPFVSDCVWNGLIVHRHVHAELTLAGVLNHEQLLLHCQQSGYSVAWYEPFCEEYARVKRVG